MNVPGAGEADGVASVQSEINSAGMAVIWSQAKATVEATVNPQATVVAMVTI